MLRRFAPFLLIIALASAAGCVHLPQRAELAGKAAPHLSPMAPGGLVDRRARFRELFCAAFERHVQGGTAEGECAEWLWQLPDESQSRSRAPAPNALQVYLITGAFSECFGPEARPFADEIPALEAAGHAIDTIVVGGRSGPEHNAVQIADYLQAHPPRPGLSVVMIGYSKGINDALQFLVDFPDLARQVDAVVSLAGSVAGSALAAEAAALYDVVLAHWPNEHCDPGDGEVIDSLRVDERRRWLEQHPLPEGPQYFSIAAFATRDRVASVLVPAWEWLLTRDDHNDGQLLTRDALLPNSSLLGYLHADHWAVAIAVEQEFDTLAARRDERPFPRGALLDAILTFVGESLHRH
ncbi:MAG TPA: hypothetical protein VLT59_13135 [Steroidobacteraceae bacterium]|nr:hypothetical protein [Steroidobacteraceae bacterium]